MNCPVCQTENPRGARFCMYCGAALARQCPNCQTELPADARFCMHCGQPIRVRTSADDLRHDRLRAAAPSPLVEMARAANLGGERRVVTILFVDVVASTRLADQLDVETWTALLNGVFERVAPCVYRYEGTIARLLGDSLVAFFGTPVTHEDDPVRAVRAALDVLEQLRGYSAEIERTHAIDFKMRICLNTGPVVVGAVSDDLKYEFNAVGGAVNLAARLKFAAPPLTVLASEFTQPFIAPLFDTTDLGLIHVTGRSRPVRVYQVTGPRAQPLPTRGLVGLSSPMVGRDAELQTLLRLADATRAGLGRGAVIVGEPGLGKSRLVTEWRSVIDGQTGRREPQWALAHCRSYGQGVAYHLLVNLVRALVGAPENASSAETRRTLDSRLAAVLPPDDTTTAGHLAHLLHLDVPEPVRAQLQRFDPQTLQATYQSAVQRLVRALAARRPLFVVLEDVHWADASSVTLIGQLLPLAISAPILFCLVGRPEADVPGWQLMSTARTALGGSLHELTLRTLSEADSRRLVSNLLAFEMLPDPLRTLILGKAEGNPLFVEEVIRMLIDRHAIVRQDDGWTVGAAVDDVEIPDNLHGLLLARIDRLPDDVKETLRVAAVIGRQFPIKVLAHVLGESAP